MSKYAFFVLLLLSTVCTHKQVIALAETSFKPRDSSLTSETPSQSQSVSGEGDQFTNSPIFIPLVCLVAFNVLVFVIVYGCLACIKRKFVVDLSLVRMHKSNRYPQITYFQTRPYCLIESQKFLSSNCFQREEVITEVPAFVYGMETEAQNNQIHHYVIHHCSRCAGMTRSVSIYKYGKLRECWQTLFMLLISPCFLAFTIRTITSNNILWLKVFCGQCGLEKEKRSKV